jgi:hypothetical protein
MTDEKLTEIIERLARIEEKVGSITSTSDSTKDLVAKHETDIQRAKGVIFFLGILTSIISIKNFIK